MMRGMRLLPIAVTALVLPTVVACSQITESAPVQEARNQAVCAAIGQPLQTLQDNVGKVASSPAGQVAGNTLQTAESALQTAMDTATGQVAATLLGLDQSLVALLKAWTAGAVPAELQPLIQAVQADIGSVQTACS